MKSEFECTQLCAVAETLRFLPSKSKITNRKGGALVRALSLGTRPSRPESNSLTAAGKVYM